MGFISFNEKYYQEKLEDYENKSLSDSEIYEVKQLLKILDDLVDEGYTNLNERMEIDFSCITRLRNILHKSNAEPFVIDHKRLSNTTYSKEEYELQDVLENLIDEVKYHNNVSTNPFLEEIYRYCNWINREEDTAYVFLIRDALLPYTFFSARKKDNIYPWLISRRFLKDITKTEDVDDDIRLPLYDALECGYIDFDDYFSFFKKRILKVLDEHQELKKVLLDILGSIKQKKIMVIESGYMGTMPMLLKSLDNRVDFRMFTTAPFLYDTYKDKILCQKYEDVRRFETLYSQDLLLEYSSYHNGKFYVKVSTDKFVCDKSLSEIKKYVIK